MSILEALAEPFQFGFMVRAFWGTSLIAVLAGLVGTFIMLKGLAFIGDAVAHASFGGIVAAMLLGLPLQLGALAFGFGTALLVALMGRKTPLRPDTSLAILFTGSFALGVLGLATRPNFAGELSTLLVGSVLAISPGDLAWIVAAVAVTAAVMFCAFRHLVYTAFDPAGAQAAGLPVSWLQTLLLGLVALAVVVSLRAAGVILVVALLITPAATASLLTRRIERVIAWAVVFGLVATWVGLYASYYLATPPGATIVTVLTLQFAAGLAVHNLRRAWQRRSAVRQAA